MPVCTHAVGRRKPFANRTSIVRLRFDISHDDAPTNQDRDLANGNERLSSYTRTSPRVQRGTEFATTIGMTRSSFFRLVM